MSSFRPVSLPPPKKVDLHMKGPPTFACIHIHPHTSTYVCGCMWILGSRKVYLRPRKGPGQPSLLPSCFLFFSQMPGSHISWPFCLLCGPNFLKQMRTVKLNTEACLPRLSGHAGGADLVGCRALCDASLWCWQSSRSSDSNFIDGVPEAQWCPRVRCPCVSQLLSRV